MSRLIKKILLEPFIHFLILGGLLYIYYESVTQIEGDKKELITISNYEILQMKAEYKKRWNKEMSDTALESLIQKKYYEKILLREAFALGLEKKDKQISDRLLEQMQFILANASASHEPSEEELHSYYLKNIRDYSELQTISFAHIYFENAEAQEFEEVLGLLKIADVKAQNAKKFGDSFSASNSINNLDFESVAKIFGKYFASKVFQLKQGRWHGPLYSQSGLHLVYITDKNTSNPYEFDEVQERVYLDYINTDKKNKFENAYKKIAAQYNLRVE
ncbi:peptidyl-prolyl cis-trans isomerase [bacterium]|nr:peptidyl-prolyl cis-trans isomerase [bacterium]MBU1993446.1 peptidyl-prolyl cis-trans isomerase [bacterium]